MEQRSRTAEHKLKQYISESFIQMMKENPELRRQMVAQEFKLKLPDAAAEKENELETLIINLAIERIKANPELADNIVNAKIRHLIREEGRAAGQEYREGYAPTTLERALSQIDAYRELKNRLGVGKWWGFLDVFKDKDVIMGLLSLLNSRFGAKPRATPELIHVAKVDGTVREMSENEYQQHTKEGRIQPLTEPDLPAPDNNIPDKKVASESDGKENVSGSDMT